MQDLLILGAGGQAKEVCWLARATGKYRVVGFLDRETGPSLRVGAEELSVLSERAISDFSDDIVLAIGVGSPDLMQRLSHRYRGMRKFPNLFHPSAQMDESGVQWGEGNIVAAGVVLTTSIVIGSHNLFNSNCTIGHDTNIGDCNVINPTASISGGVQIGNCNLIGTHSVVLQYRKIGNNNLVGAGAVVTKNIQSGVTVIGVPARERLQ